MVKKVIAFDLDGTLADSKSAIHDHMAELLVRLLDAYHVCVISGGKFEQFEKQLLANLKAEARHLARLHLMPSSGTRYYTFHNAKQRWHKIYAEDFTAAQKRKIIGVLEAGIEALGYRAKQTWGDTIEDRGSQITFSALGQEIVSVLGNEGIKIKEAWDQDGQKKEALRSYAAKLLPEFEVRAGGVTSIDVTKKGIDKSHGIRKLMEALGVSKDDILFIGDRLEEGGNDYPVKVMGVDCLAISHWRETALAVQAILHTA